MSSVNVLLLLPMLGLLGGGVVLILLSRRGRRPYPSCGKCRYDMSGTIGTTDRCPECGSALADVGLVPPGRGPHALALAASGAVLLVIALGCFGTSLASIAYARAAAARAQAQARAARAQAQAAQAQPAQGPGQDATPPADGER